MAGWTGSILLRRGSWRSTQCTTRAPSSAPRPIPPKPRAVDAAALPPQKAEAGSPAGNGHGQRPGREERQATT